MLAPQKESIFGCSCRLWLLSWRCARIFARSCSLLSKYLPISWKQRKEQSHAQCHVTHRIRIFDKISEHVKVAKWVDIAVPELAVTERSQYIKNGKQLGEKSGVAASKKSCVIKFSGSAFNKIKGNSLLMVVNREWKQTKCVTKFEHFLL